MRTVLFFVPFLVSFIPQSQTNPLIRAGFPNTSAWAGTSLVTTEPAPTRAYAPIVIPATMVEFAPMEAPSQTLVFETRSSLQMRERGYRSLVKHTCGPMNTLLPTVRPW